MKVKHTNSVLAIWAAGLVSFGAILGVTELLPAASQTTATAVAPAATDSTPASTPPASPTQWWWLNNDVWSTMTAEGPRCKHALPNDPLGFDSPKAMYDNLKQKWQLPRIDDKGDEIDVVYTVDVGVKDTIRFFRGEKACLIALAPFRDRYDAAVAKDRDTERYR